MFKKSVLALALFAGLLSSSTSFANTGADLVITSAAITPNLRLQVGYMNRGAGAAACSRVRVTLQGTAVDRTPRTVEFDCIALGGGQSGMVDVLLPASFYAALFANHGKLVYLTASIDSQNAVDERFTMKIGGADVAYDGELNNTRSFAIVP